MGHHYPFFVPWSEFIVGVCKALNVPVKLEDPGFLSMKALLSTKTAHLLTLDTELLTPHIIYDRKAEEYKDMTSSKYPDIVRCEKFGDFLGRFGPLIAEAPTPDLISRVRTPIFV